MPTLLNPRFRLVTFIIWCLCWPAIAVLLLTPLPFNLISRTDLLGHFLLFAVMSVAVIAFARSRMQILILSLITVAFGIALEFGQAYVPGRFFDVADTVANALGGVVGCLLALALLERLFSPQTRKQHTSAHGGESSRA